jgi:DNA topoisomerase I
VTLAAELAQAGLHAVSPFEPGIRRLSTSAGFAYRDQYDNPVSNPDTLQRIRKLSIPPAWRDVWIAADPSGHVQATGFDRAGRKQYRYHAQWRELRDEEKFDKIVSFGEALPAIRETVSQDLVGNRLDHKQVLGCAVRLLDLGSFRIGSDRYAVEDDTHGLTTLLAREVQLDGNSIVFNYVGKEHKHQLQHVVDEDARKVVAELLEQRRPDERLFAFSDGRRWGDLHSGDVNHYLREAAGMRASAKEYRTWNATVLAASVLARLESPASRHAAERAFKSAVTTVAGYLGNTPAIARRAYVDPRIFDRYRAGFTIQPELAGLGIDLEARPPSTRRPVELAVLDLIQARCDSAKVRQIRPIHGAPA